MIHLRQIISSVGQIFQLPGRKPFTAKPALCETKMRNFLLGLVLGLLAVVHSTPVDTVTQIVPKSEDDVFREAVTDGFLVDYSNLLPVTTESPKTNTSVQPSQQPGSTTQVYRHGLDIIEEGSAIGEINDGFKVATTTQSISTAPSSTSASDQSVVSQTTYNILSTLSESGSGDFIDDLSATTSSTTSETSPVSTTSVAPVDFAPRSIGESPEPTQEAFSGSGSGLGSGSGSEPEQIEAVVPLQTARINFVQAAKVEPTAATMPAGHTTPDWIIILGFIVGVAALVLLCVAIATRDKWNAPKYAAQPAANTNDANQQRALEMETFLNKDMPKENGKAAEYTVIPLEELPENYSSH